MRTIRGVAPGLTLSILKISIFHKVNDIYYSFKTHTSQYQGKNSSAQPKYLQISELIR